MTANETQMHQLESFTVHDLDPEDGMRLIGEPITEATFKDVIIVTGTIDGLFDGPYVKQIGSWSPVPRSGGRC